MKKEQWAEVLKIKDRRRGDQGSGAHTRDQHQKSWRTTGSCGVIGSGDESTVKVTIAVKG